MSNSKVTKRYLITTHTPGLRANRRLLDAMSVLAEVYQAEQLTILTKPLRQSAAVDEWIDEETICFRSRQLNSNLRLIADSIAITTSDDPTAQYMVEAGKTCSLIIASPKRYQRAIPRASGIPRYVLTTLSCDRPDLLTDTKNERKASHLHTQGCVLVEIVDDELWFAHQLEAERDGSITCNGHRFHSNGRVTRVYAEAVSLGDTHIGHTDPEAEAAAMEVIREVNPKYVTQEDAFDGSSINHHEGNNHLSNMHWPSLEDEAIYVAGELQRHIDTYRKLAPRFRKLILKDSNHHDFLDRYIQDFSRWMTDNKNKKLALRLAVAADDGAHLLEHLLRRYAPLKHAQFLRVGESCVIAGVELAYHGHAGANGAKGSAKQFQRALSKSNIGHTHVPEVCDTVFNAGTLSVLRPAYAARGLTSWCHGLVVTYPSGSRQLVRIIGGQWRAPLESSIRRALKRRAR